MENEIIREKVEEYLKLFDDIRARTGDDRTAVTILQEVKKDLRMAQIRAERENSNGKSNSNGNDNGVLASAAQIGYLKKLGVKIPIGLTKKQASSLIDEATAKGSQQDSSAIPVQIVRVP